VAKETLKKGTTSKRLAIFIQDSSKTTGEGLTGLLFSSSGLSWYYWREDEGNVGGTTVTLVTATRGTFASGGFIEKDATNMPGFYEIGIPNAAIATGAGWVVMQLKGATNMAELTLEVQLTDNTVKDVFDVVNSGTFGNAQLVRSTTPANTLDVSGTGEAGMDWANVGSQATAVNLSATTVNLVNTATAVTNNVNAALANVAHGGVASVLTLERIIVASTTATEPAMKLTGNTSGAGLLAAGGATGSGIVGTGGGTSGDGFLGTVTSGNEFSGSLSGSVGSIATGGIAALSFAAGAVNAAALATDAAAEISDNLLGRNIAGGSDGGRTVTDTFRVLRNKVSISGGTLTVTQENDTTTAWTAAVVTTAGDPISSVDPV